MFTLEQRLLEGLRVSGLGLLGVFSVLIIFYVVILLLDKIKEKPQESSGTGE